MVLTLLFQDKILNHSSKASRRQISEMNNPTSSVGKNVELPKQVSLIFYRGNKKLNERQASIIEWQEGEQDRSPTVGEVEGRMGDKRAAEMGSRPAVTLQGSWVSLAVEQHVKQLVSPRHLLYWP